MEARSIAKYVRVSPRKAGQVCSLVRGKNVDEALAIMKFTPKASTEILEKLQNGYYDDIHKIKVDKKKEYKLDDDNIQYCFF